MRDAAIAVLAKSQVPSLLAARAAREQELAHLEQQLGEAKESVSWRERAFFVRQTPDATRARELEEAVARAREARDQAAAAADRATAEASTQLPPIWIALAVERVTAAALEQPMVGRRPTPEGDALAAELERIADRVVAIWVPGFDAAHVADALRDDRARAEAAAQIAGPPRTDPRLGWAPIEPAELAGRAATLLSGPDFRDARACLEREAFEHATAIRQVGEARERIGLGDKLAFGQTDNEQHLALAEQLLAKERRELLAASEAVHDAVERAFAAYPPMGIFNAALGAAGILGAALEGSEQTIVVESGEVYPLPSACLRAMLLAALVELRRATEAAFPGLGALVSGRGGVRDARDLARAAATPGAALASPYRSQAAADDEPPPAPPSTADAEAWLGAAIERTDVRAGLGRALAHGVMLGTILRSRGASCSRIGWADQLTSWSVSRQSWGVDEAEVRVYWHRAVAFALSNAALASVGQAALPLGVVRIRNGLVQSHAALRAVSTRMAPFAAEPCPLHGLAAAVAAVDELGRELSRSWGPRGDKSAFAYDVVRHLSTSPPVPPPTRPGEALRPLFYGEIVVMAAEALRGSDFVALEARLRQAASEADLARAVALLDGALASYPPAALYYALGGIHARVANICASFRTGMHGQSPTCEILGKAAALDALSAWTRNALGVFGAMPTDGELLERFVARELRGT